MKNEDILAEEQILRRSINLIRPEIDNSAHEQMLTARLMVKAYIEGDDSLFETLWTEERPVEDWKQIAGELIYRVAESHGAVAEAIRNYDNFVAWQLVESIDVTGPVTLALEERARGVDLKGWDVIEGARLRGRQVRARAVKLRELERDAN